MSSTETVKIAKCPVCDSFILNLHFMRDGKDGPTSKWYHCHCGVVWQADQPEPYDVPADRYKDGGWKYKDACLHYARTYLPLIEEAVYGRKVLIVGATHPYFKESLEERGWIPFEVTAEAFETTNFAPEHFSLIWLVGSLERLTSPTYCLKKSFNLLTEDGILLMATPDTDFIYTRSSSNFAHWKPYHNLMWNRRSLTSHLEQLGFNTLVCRQNQEHRFAGTDELHIVAQKKFF